MPTRTVVIGEALIDIVRSPGGAEEEHIGGSPLNVAMGLAALGHQVDFATTIGRDRRGDAIDAHLRDGAVRLVGERMPDPTSTALAELDASGAANYRFDLHWNLPSVPLADDVGHVHTGSIAAMLAPGSASVLEAVGAGHARGTVSYDPNMRPTIMGAADDVRARVEQIIAQCDLVKASSDDLDFLYPRLTAAEVMARWCALGASLTIVTLGAHGVTYRCRGSEEVGAAPTRAQRVVDTVGAGDSFMAGVVSGLLTSGLLGDPHARERLASATLEDVRPAVGRGLACSAVTVGHAGAHAPTLEEL